MRNGAKPKANRQRTHSVYSGKNQQDKMAHALDDLAEFEEFRETLLPALRRDLNSGMSEAEIAKKYAAHAQTRIIQIALMEQDAGKALAAAKDLLDRTNGKATEKREVTHKFDSLSDQELDALIMSEEEELHGMSERFEQ